MNKEKEYVFRVELKFEDFIPANNEEEAMKILKKTYKRDHNIELEDQDYELIQVYDYQKGGE